jgi:hypothetical protein
MSRRPRETSCCVIAAAAAGDPNTRYLSGWVYFFATSHSVTAMQSSVRAACEMESWCWKIRWTGTSLLAAKLRDAAPPRRPSPSPRQ